MSGRAAFVGGIVAVAVTVAVVQFQQNNDRAEMRKGVERDIERMKLKRQQQRQENKS